MTRNGKIARLPRHIRHSLNSRLDNGEQGKDLVDWLNALPDVQSALAADFEGRPISEQNLSEWKQGGFRDWQLQQQTCDRVRSLIELSDDLDGAADEQHIPERLASVLAAELAAETRQLLDATTDPKERWRYLSDALRQVNALRQGDYAAARAALERQRWEIECDRLEQEETKREANELRSYITRPFSNALRRRTILSMFGGDKNAAKIADFFEHVDKILEDPPPFRDFPPPDQTEIKPDQTESNLIKPDQTSAPSKFPET